MRAVNLQTLETLIRPAVEGQDYELVELHWGRGPGSGILRITIDRPPGQGHVSHSDCVQVSREVSALLDVNDILPGKYSLEVSSPGLDRPLKRSADFQRFIGQRAKVRMRPDVQKSNLGPLPEGAAPRRSVSGTILSVADEVVTLEADGIGPVTLHLAEMEKANLIYSF